MTSKQTECFVKHWTIYIYIYYAVKKYYSYSIYRHVDVGSCFSDIIKNFLADLSIVHEAIKHWYSAFSIM